MKDYLRFLLSTGVAAGLCFGGCGGSGEQASKMTSFSTAESPEAKAELFSLPANQMAHIQVLPVEQAALPRTLRLTGAVEYNDFKTTPVISQVGGAVSRVVVVPGEKVAAGQALLYVASPDFSLLRSAYIKARDAFQLADKFYLRAKDLYQHHAIAEADLEQAESTRAQAQADLESSTDAIRVLGIADPEKIVTKPASPEVPLYSPVAGEVVDRQCSPGQLLAAGGTTVFHAVGYEFGMDSGEHLPKRRAVRARRGRGDGHQRIVSGRYRARQDRIHFSGAGSEHAHAAGKD